MAIKLKRNNNFVYLGKHKILNTQEKERADHIYSKSKKELERLEGELENRGVDNVLERWHETGQLVKQLLQNFDIKEKERKYFWIMMYDVGKEATPQHIKKFGLGRNDFRLAFILTDYPLSRLKEVGPWSLWREIIGSKKINEDIRIARWVAQEIIKNKHIKTRDSARPFLKKVRNRLKNLNTEVLTKKELIEKLKEIGD